jgi:hypothetical protein
VTIRMVLYKAECAKVERGQTIRIDHSDCPAGEDTRRRLYLTRPAGSPNVVLAYCHNCQESGVQRGEFDKYRDYVAPSTEMGVLHIPFQEPSGLEWDPDNWPIAATSWRVLKGLGSNNVRQARIAYDPTTHRIYIPMYDYINTDAEPTKHSTLIGYQLRHIEGVGPKYLTALKDSSTKPFTRIGPLISKYCVLVEDLASGLALAAVADDHNLSILVNYGVQIKPEALYSVNDCGMARQRWTTHHTPSTRHL